MYAGGGGVKTDVRFFQNLKLTKLFPQNHHFIAFLFVRIWGEWGSSQKEYFLYARGHDEKWTTHYTVRSTLFDNKQLTNDNLQKHKPKRKLRQCFCRILNFFF